MIISSHLDLVPTNNELTMNLTFAVLLILAVTWDAHDVGKMYTLRLEKFGPRSHVLLILFFG